MQIKLFEHLSENMDTRADPHNSGMGFIDLLDQSSRVSVRLSNAIRSAAAQGKLPYLTIEAYLEAGTVGRFLTSRVKNIGRKSIAELDLLIAEAFLYRAIQVVQPDNSSSVDCDTAGGGELGSTSLPSAEIGFLELLDTFYGVNTRLLSAINFAAAKNGLPYQTVAKYLEAGDIGRTRMLQVDDLDEELLSELDHIIAECGHTHHVDAHIDSGCGAEESSTSGYKLTEKLNDELNGEMHRLTLHAFVAKQRTVSARLLNAISVATNAGTCPFETIADYLNCESRLVELQKIENLGRGTAIEFERLVARSLRAKPPRSIVPNDQGYVDIGSIVKEGFSLLTGRQEEVLVERLLEKRTLETVASKRGITRERVRQIEAKSLKLLLTALGAVWRDSANIICAQLHNDGKFELSLEDFSKLVSCTNGEAAIYLALLKRFDIDQSTFGLYESNIFVCSHYPPRNTWEAVLTTELKTQPLPLVLDSVISSITTIPSFYIRDYFQRMWGPECAASETVVPKYGATRMCIDVLRRAGGPMHTSDVRARIYAQFQIDIQEHAINATLGRNEAAVITAPGTYALYESLPFTQAQIQSIRNIAYGHLADRSLFLSSKILFEEAFAPKLDEYQRELNHYLVMGIVQDDERFVTKRGNMVGLATFDLAETYTPLQEEVRRIVVDHGPISLSEITERLSDTRRLCNDSGIRLVLSQSPDIIRTGRRTFDSLHRFFETRDSYDKLLLAVRISLLEKKKTTFAITQDLSRLQFHNLTSHLIESVLLSMDDVVSQGEIHELVSATDDLVEYNEILVKALRERRPGEVESILRDSISTERLTMLMSLDTRLLTDSSPSHAESETPEVASILRDFRF